jgi:four helix bundle protein
MFRFESLEIWNDAINFGLRVYDVTDIFPKHELFGLTSQLRRAAAAVSISSNIAEGSGCSSTRGFCNYLDISIRSTLETISQLQIAKRRGYIDDETYRNLYDEAEILIKKIRSFKKSLNNHKP